MTNKKIKKIIIAFKLINNQKKAIIIPIKNKKIPKNNQKVGTFEINDFIINLISIAIFNILY